MTVDYYQDASGKILLKKTDSEQKDLNKQLFEAAWKGDNDAIVDLLSKGAQINSTHDMGATALYVAVERNFPKIVELLIDNGANVNIALATGDAPLHMSTSRGYTEITKLLLDAGADKEAITEEGSTPAVLASYHGNLKDLELLLDYGAEIISDHIRTVLQQLAHNRDKTPEYNRLYQQIMNRYLEYVKTSKKDQTIDPNEDFEVVISVCKRDISFWAPIEFPTERVTVYNKCGKDLSNLPANFKIENIPNTGWLGGTYLYHIEHRYTSLAKRTYFSSDYPYDGLIYTPQSRYKYESPAKGQNIIAKTVKRTLITESNIIGNLTKADWLQLENYQNFEPLNYSMVDFAHIIDEDLPPETVLNVNLGAQLAADREDLLRHPKSLYTKLRALFGDQYATADFLLEKLWDILLGLTTKELKILNNELLTAARKGDNNAIIELLRKGAQVNSIHDHGVTPIFLAARYNRTDTAALLINNEADVNIIADQGGNALYESAYRCHSSITQLLVNAGANKEAKMHGYSPLSAALVSRCVEDVQILVDSGAQIYYKDPTQNFDIYSPLYIAASNYKKSNKVSNDIYKIIMDRYWQSIESNVQGMKTTNSVYNFDSQGINEIALIMMVKNEEDIIFENLAWHFVMGFRKFIIIDNASTDKTKQLIKNFADLTEKTAKVFIIDDPIFEHIQGRIITGAYSLARSVWPEVTWIFPVDADEFWIAEQPLNEILRKIPDHIDTISVVSAKYFASDDYYNFDNTTKFYDKLHYRSYSYKEHHEGKVAIRSKNCITIAQGNHYASITPNCGLNTVLNDIPGNLFNLNMYEFPIRSIAHAHKKFSNGIEANNKAIALGLVPANTAFHWSTYAEYMNKYGEKAGEVRFNDSFIDLAYALDDALLIGKAINKFYDIVHKSDIQNLNDQFFEAVQKEDKDTIIKLVNIVDVNSKDDDNNTALHTATTNGNIKTVEILLAIEGINVDAALDNGVTALYTAIYKKYSDITLLLLNAGANPNAIVNGYKLLHLAAHLGSVTDVKNLIDKGATVDYGRSFAHTTFFIESVIDNRNKSPEYSKIYDLIMQSYWMEFKNSQPETQIIPIQNANQTMSIPQIIHRVWTIWNPEKPDMPEVYKEFDLVLRDLHQDWQFMEWDDKKILSFINEFYPEFLPTYLSYDEPVKRHDACRYFIMDHFGGVFIQHSFKFQKNIKPLLDGADLVLSENTRYSGLLQNGFLASVPHHPFWKILIDALPNKAHLSTLDATGPHFLAAFVKDYLARAEHTPIKILNREYLLPFNWNEKHIPIINSTCIQNTSQCFELFPDAYSFNLWSWTWRDSTKNTAKVDLSVLEDNSLEPDYKVLVLNLPKSTKRLEKISKKLDSAGVPYEVFVAVNGYHDVELTNTLNGQHFIGRDIIDKKIEISLNTPYKVICNSKIYEQASFTVTLTQRPLNAGEFGRWCSDVVMWQYINKNNYTTTIVFEDDFEPLEHNFKPLVDNFIKALPSGYHIGYLDTWIMEGGITPLTGNRNHIAQFMSNSKWYGTWAVVLSKKFITEILSTNHYYGMQDEMLLRKAQNNELEVYISTLKLTNIPSIELTGLSENSEVSKMGVRANHPNSGNFDLEYRDSQNTATIDISILEPVNQDDSSPLLGVSDNG